jgi:hypothetical protein
MRPAGTVEFAIPKLLRCGQIVVFSGAHFGILKTSEPMTKKKPTRKNGHAAAARAKGRWGTKSKAARSEFASKIGAARWAGLSKRERAKLVPRTGGRPAKYPVRCTRYRSHIFSPSTGRCPCGFVRSNQTA